MTNTTIGGALLREMFLTGAALLDKNKALIDSLNVFPVPDGDTGTNMFMTMQGAVKEIKECKGDTVAEVAAAASLGSLRGARGNSGVILSQILRGFSRALAGAEEMDATLLAQALKTGTEAAYKAVMKPKEGTMLTVSRMISDAVTEAAAEGANVYKLIDLMLESGEVALRITPDLLPVLREAGVYVAVQGCEHINRSLCVERDCMERYHLAEVWVEPWLHAGGAFCTEAAERFADHVMVEDLRGQATLGIDIGGTLIGMHMRPVVVPVHAALRQIGSAVLILAKSRPRYVGGPRAHYPSQAAPR